MIGIKTQASCLYLNILASFVAISEYFGKMSDSPSAIRVEEDQVGVIEGAYYGNK